MLSIVVLCMVSVAFATIVHCREVYLFTVHFGLALSANGQFQSQQVIVSLETGGFRDKHTFVVFSLFPLANCSLYCCFMYTNLVCYKGVVVFCRVMALIIQY